jgi:glyoxylase-like metal-dependent hydrolase (beta-lactamase superfamily II)
MTGPGNNTYLIVGTSGSATLIDAGVGEPQHLADLESALITNRASLDWIVATHGHRDHVAGAPAIASAYPKARLAKYPWPAEDGHDGMPWQPLADGDIVSAGDETLSVLHTPGHSPDHLAFWHEPSRTIFTGDLVVQGSSVMIHWSAGGDLSQYMASLERLLALEPRRLLPAHGVEIDNPRLLLTGYLDHRRMREQQVLEALRSGSATVQSVTESIYHGLGPALLPAARENVRAHLEKLKIDGVARDHDGQWTLS